MIEIKEIKKKLAEKLNVKNIHTLPRLEKIVLNVGAGQVKEDKTFMEEVMATLTAISGQKPMITKAKKAIAGFKIRANDPVGAMVTLRGKKMLSFLERLVNIALPRIRDFKGLPLKNFDRQGNYSMGIKEQIIFPEIPYDKIKHIHGLQITFKLSRANPQTGRVLLETLGVPFEKNQAKKGVSNG
jgi:large subunit ribosomal protein L5